MGMLCPHNGGDMAVETVGPGHPDKVCDQISDAVLDAALKDDPNSRVAIETAGKSRIHLIGEMTTASVIDLRDLAMRVHREIGYRDDEVNGVDVDVVQQSPDIAMGTNSTVQGAGDQGTMVGYAVNTPEHDYMPIAYTMARRLVMHLDYVRRTGVFTFLRPDSKSQVVMKDGRVVHVTIATQHTDGISTEDLRRAVYDEVVIPVIGDIAFEACTINGTGRFVKGSFAADAGLTGRKIVCDAYGAGVPVGGGAFSGKDPTKVDRTAAYMARFIAKMIVVCKMAEEALIHLAYTIGQTEPDSVNVRVCNPSDQSFNFEHWVRDHFPLSPAGMIAHLGLAQPNGWSYREAAAFGHFGRPQFPWEQVTAD